ncbi:MAG: tRNA preQ1(34) S-adenosylmethionine ribosyltransferase-isomerase QueA [Bacteroidota bacterium]
MKLIDFKYPIPRNLIAKKPTNPRDKARLLVVDRKTEKIEDCLFSDIYDFFEKGDSLIVNETKVFPARLIGRKEKTNAKIEVLMLRELNKEDNIWDVIVEPARKVRIGNKIYFGDGSLMCEVIDNTTSRGRTMKFEVKGDIFAAVEKVGITPLPPYIRREATEKDKNLYQTIYAKNIGAVAAPTAGLHFTKPLLNKIIKKGVKVSPVTLHIGIGTFRNVEVEDLSKHKMDSEYYSVPMSSVHDVNKSIDNRHKLYVVGTSTCRAIESSVTIDGHLKSTHGWTDKFIFQRNEFKITQKLITNFHMPETTLLMLVSAFGGHDLIMKAYKHAIKKKYRFYSYGDAMIIV